MLLTFFFLKDGRRMWDWFGPFISAPQHDAGTNWLAVFVALGGYVRGIALVGLVDALLIGLALLVIGVPLVLPLMVLTFWAPSCRSSARFLAGLAAVLITLVYSNGCSRRARAQAAYRPRPAGRGATSFTRC